MIQQAPSGARAWWSCTVTQVRRKVRHVNREVTRARCLGVVCGLILAGLLVAGLWPFHSPRNEVTWSASGTGLLFGRHGTILSSGIFKAANAQANSPCSIELWLEPGSTTGSGTLLAFYAPDRLRQFSLHQSISDLALRSDVRVGGSRNRTTRFYVDDIFRRGKALFITITAYRGRTSVYIDGVLAKVAPGFPLAGKDFVGELVVANWPTTEDSWSGLLRGLAFYDQELSPAQVLHNYVAWTTRGRPPVSVNDRPVALYLFDEGAGRAIHSQVPSGIGLYIPDRYRVIDEVFFRPFWEEFQPSWSYCDDLLINIAGFIPLGLICCAYLSSARGIERPALLTILLGFTVSLTIESLQGFLPTRDSGTTDLITNTLGTCFGVWLYRSSFWRVLFARIGTYLRGVSDKEQTALQMD